MSRKKSKRKMMVMSIILCCAMILPGFSLSASTTLEYRLSSIADSVITKDTPSEIITYKAVADVLESGEKSELSTYGNIQEFIQVARQETDVSDYELGKFILLYTNLLRKNSPGSFPEHAILDALNYKNITSSMTYYKVTADGSRQETDREIVQAAAVSSSDDDWMSDDGYIGIRTSAIESGTAGASGKGRLYNVIVEQCWFKRPIWFFNDVLAVNTTATYDDTFLDWASYDTAAYVDDDSRIKHNVAVTKNNRTQYGCTLFYPQETITGMAFEINTLEIKNPTGGVTFGWASESRLGMRIIVDPNKSANIKGAYCHKQVGLGDISVSLPDGGISFGLVGAKADYTPPAITVINY